MHVECYVAIWLMAHCLLATSSNVLFLPCGFESHMKTMLPYAEEAARVGHNVMVLQVRPRIAHSGVLHLSIHSQRVGNLTSVIWYQYNKRGSFDVFNLRNQSAWTTPYFGDPLLFQLLASDLVNCMDLFGSSAHALGPYHPYMMWLQKHVFNASWDLIVVDGLPSLCTRSLTSLINAPLVQLHVVVQPPVITRYFGIPSPSSVVQNNWSVNFQHQEFWDRFSNGVAAALAQFALRFLEYHIVKLEPRLDSSNPFYITPALRRENTQPILFQTLWQDLPKPQLPTAKVFWSWPPRRKLENQNIPVSNSCSDAAIQPRPRRILATFGHMYLWNHASEMRALRTLQTAFNSIQNATIYWQVSENLTVHNLSLAPHVHVQQWWPQTDLLCGTASAPAVDAFVTHGGLKSTHEALICGVPMLLIPLWADQAAVVAGIVHKKAGLMMSKHDITADLLVDNIERVLRMKRPAVDEKQIEFEKNTALFWLSYVLRHKPKVLTQYYAILPCRLLYHIDIARFVFLVISISLLFMFVAATKKQQSSYEITKANDQVMYIKTDCNNNHVPINMRPRYFG